MLLRVVVTGDPGDSTRSNSASPGNGPVEPFGYFAQHLFRVVSGSSGTGKSLPGVNRAPSGSHRLCHRQSEPANGDHDATAPAHDRRHDDTQHCSCSPKRRISVPSRSSLSTTAPRQTSSRSRTCASTRFTSSRAVSRPPPSSRSCGLAFPLRHNARLPADRAFARRGDALSESGVGYSIAHHIHHSLAAEGNAARRG